MATVHANNINYKRDQKTPKIWVAIFLCVLVIFYAHNDVPNIGNLFSDEFARPQSFVANPGGSFTKANVRSGPGVEFPVVSEVERGTAIIGIRRKQDTNGEPWIGLDGDEGFIKETILLPLPGAEYD